jgi:hypothetical protein
MDLAALIIGAVVGGVAGAVGYLAALAAQRFWHLPKPPYWLAAAFAVVGIAGGSAVLGGWVPSWSALTAEPIALADVLPYMQAIKTHEPALYERIETSVIRDHSDGMSADRVRANATALIRSYVADKTVFLPDQLTYELFVTTRDELAYLGERQDYATCANLALGRANPDLESKLSPELVERSNNNTVRVLAIKVEPDAPKMPGMPAEEFSQLAARSFAEALQVTGIPADELDSLLAGTGDDTKACKLMKAFFDAVLSQPVGTAAAAFRTLASGERAPAQ